MVTITKENITAIYGENVTIECGVPEGYQAEFTWSAPPASTSFSRATITTNSTSSALTFTADENDSGEFTCTTGFNGNASANIEIGKTPHHDNIANIFYTHFSVPTIVVGPRNQTLDPTDPLFRATFTCTAFGGDGIMLNFAWSHSISTSGLNASSQIEFTNDNGSTTSSISTNNLSLDDYGSQYTCAVSYPDQDGSSNNATAILTLGM